MARRRSSPREKPARGVTKKPMLLWPNLQGLIDNHGQISVGHLHPIPCAAVANDEHNMLAALVQQPGETLTDLLDRLEAAVERPSMKKSTPTRSTAKPMTRR